MRLRGVLEARKERQEELRGGVECSSTVLVQKSDPIVFQRGCCFYRGGNDGFTI